jgi:hypothetical protein
MSSQSQTCRLTVPLRYQLEERGIETEEISVLETPQSFVNHHKYASGRCMIGEVGKRFDPNDHLFTFAMA